MSYLKLREQAKELLENYVGISDVKEYSLVNNWGFSYTYEGNRYDSRFWANCYGEELNCFITTGVHKGFCKVIDARLNDLPAYEEKEV